MEKSRLDFWTVATVATGFLFGFAVATQTESFWPPIIAAFIGAGLVRGVQYLAMKNGAEGNGDEQG